MAGHNNWLTNCSSCPPGFRWLCLIRFGHSTIEFTRARRARATELLSFGHNRVLRAGRRGYPILEGDERAFPLLGKPAVAPDATDPSGVFTWRFTFSSKTTICLPSPSHRESPRRERRS